MAAIFGAYVNGRGLLAQLDPVVGGGDQDRDRYRDPGPGQHGCSRCCYVLFAVCRVVLDERPAAVRIVAPHSPHRPPEMAPFASPSLQEAPRALALYAACHFTLSTFCFSASLLLLLLLIVAVAAVVVGIFALRCRWRCRCTVKLPLLLLLLLLLPLLFVCRAKQQQRETTLHCLLFVWFSAKTLLLLPLSLLPLLPFLPLCQFLPLPFWQARNESKLKQKPNNLTGNATATLAAVR